uniref:Nudix hydrolase domain-containing protein n=1 Tax=Skeletonema marinoi TaxID=267567 RepID=A0A7S2P8B9_9STRA|mmetsp:Transcript_15435/g.26069  ORF Transcript_15435/g.26069 Transcript_15435/m.26069 type:complete len:269 (+) Transcript_15435:75-881(+)
MIMNVHSRRGATSRVGRRWTLLVLSIIAIISIKLFVSHIKTQQRLIAATGDCRITFGNAYRGSKYESTAVDASRTSGETIGNKCLVQSQWMRVAQHQVKLMDKVIDDWLWIDYHDRINVLVQDPNSSKDNPSFLILKQTKYALSSEVSLAVVGGIVEPYGEEPPDAAKREVYEELHVTCNSWTPLGRYRTDVNRGMGWIHPFLARDCKYGEFDDGSGEPSNADVGAHDMEKQNVQSMTLSEVKVSVMNQKFIEVQWSNTVALAMLHLM